MTGFGFHKHDDSDIESMIEIRSLNSRFLDINLKLPKVLVSKEMEIRNIISDKLVRGKVGVDIDVRTKSNPLNKVVINEELFRSYYKELRRLADKVMAPHEGLFKLAIQSPDVTLTEIEDEQLARTWEIVMDGLEKACDDCIAFRLQEGQALMGKFKEYVQNIDTLLKGIDKFEKARIEKIKERIRGNFNEFISKEKFDTNRFEQEILYYLEKLDISEEKVRLKNHLQYFLEVMDEEKNVGKKLGFISQEIGREINTIGSKASDSDVQKIVVGMKDELEKIKEQLANIV